MESQSDAMRNNDRIALPMPSLRDSWVYCLQKPGTEVLVLCQIFVEGLSKHSAIAWRSSGTKSLKGNLS